MLSFPSDFPFTRKPVAPAVPEPAAKPPKPAAAPPRPAQDEPAPVTPVAPVPTATAAHQESEADVVCVDPRSIDIPLTPVAPAPPRLIERRKVRRDTMAAQALIRMDGVHGPPIKIALMDISIAGVRFRSAQPIDVGEKGQIRLEVGPLRWTTRLQIVHCQRDGRGLSASTIGCAFLRTELLRPWPVSAA